MLLTDARGETMAPYQVADRHIFERDHLVLLNALARGLVVEVGALAFDGLLLLGAALRGCLAALAARLALGDPPWRRGESFLGLALVAGILDDEPIGGDEQDLHAESKARLLTSEGHGLLRNLRAGAHHLPAIRLRRDRDGFGRAFKRTRPPYRHAPNRGQDQEAVVALRAIAEVLVPKCWSVNAW